MLLQDSESSHSCTGLVVFQEIGKKNEGCVKIRGMFEMNCLLSYISICMWGRIKTNTYLSRFIQGLHNGV